MTHTEPMIGDLDDLMRATGLTPSSFETFEEERLHRKQRLAGAFRLFAKHGFDEGLAGHITARDPELTDHFWVNPFGVPFAHLRVSDLLLVDSTGKVVEGELRTSPAAFAIHAAIHEARPEVVAAAHAHTLHGKAFASLGRLLDPISQDACFFYEAHAVYESYSGVIFDPAEGHEIATVLGPTHKLVILANHGFLTVGDSVDEAAWYFFAADRAAQAQLIAEAAGTPRLIEDEAARSLGANRSVGWASFQPYWRQLVREQPDLLQ